MAISCSAVHRARRCFLWQAMGVVSALPPPSDLRPRVRWPLVLAVLASSCWLGLVTGAAIGAKWLVPAGSGLAGPAIVLGYGCAGAVAALLLAGVLAWQASYDVLRSAALGALALALVAAVLVGWRVAEVTRAGEAQSPPASSRDPEASTAGPTHPVPGPVNAEATVEDLDQALATTEWMVLTESSSAIGEPLIVAGEVVAPRIVHRVTPDFTSVEVRRLRGVPIIQLVIGTDGAVERIRVLRSVDPEYDRALVAAVSQWKFEPATRHGEPVAVYYTLTANVHFR